MVDAIFEKLARVSATVAVISAMMPPFKMFDDLANSGESAKSCGSQFKLMLFAALEDSSCVAALTAGTGMQGTVHLEFRDSKNDALIRASDIIANQMWSVCQRGRIVSVECSS